MLTETVDEELLDAAPGLKAIANMAVGTDNIDLEATAARGIAVGNTPGVLTDTTADLAFALLLAVARRLPAGEQEVREGAWGPWQPAHGLGADVAGATLGIVGWGRIGKAMARRGEGFGMEVVHSSRSSGLPLHELLERADFVSLHTPPTPATRHPRGLPPPPRAAAAGHAPPDRRPRARAHEADRVPDQHRARPRGRSARAARRA